jgi:hypothetical protein
MQTEIFVPVICNEHRFAGQSSVRTQYNVLLLIPEAPKILHAT